MLIGYGINYSDHIVAQIMVVCLRFKYMLTMLLRIVFDVLNNVQATEILVRDTQMIQRSSRPSSYDSNEIIPAHTAVFATNELLSLILSNASKENLGISHCV